MCVTDRFDPKLSAWMANVWQGIISISMVTLETINEMMILEGRTVAQS